LADAAYGRTSHRNYTDQAQHRDNEEQKGPVIDPGNCRQTRNQLGFSGNDDTCPIPDSEQFRNRNELHGSRRIDDTSLAVLNTQEKDPVGEAGLQSRPSNVEDDGAGAASQAGSCQPVDHPGMGAKVLHCALEFTRGTPVIGAKILVLEKILEPNVYS
jgi:hypothetical protein